MDSLKFRASERRLEVRATPTKVISVSQENVNLKLTVSTKEGTVVTHYTSAKSD